MLEVFAKIEAAVKTDWSELTGEARAEAEQAVADLKAGLADVKPRLAAFEEQMATLLQPVIAGVKASIQTEVADLVADLGKMIGEDL